MVDHALPDVKALAFKALDAGALIARQSTVDWNVAGKCLDPRQVTITGRPMRKQRGGRGLTKTGKWFWHERAAEHRYQEPRPGSSSPLWVDIHVPCRKCTWCLRRRTYVWVQRAANEIRTASRTWFGTLTLKPEEHFLMECRLAHHLGMRAVNWDRLTQAEQFSERRRDGGALVTKFFKKLRMRTDAPLRYFLVVEPHKSGRPHWHVLLHELDAAHPIRKASLQDCWAHGFSQWKLVDASDANRTARYVAKYLTKSTQARVRASVGYGSGELIHSSEGSVKMTLKAAAVAAGDCSIA